MTKKSNAELVREALNRRSAQTSVAFDQKGKVVAALESRAAESAYLEPYARALLLVNNHITVSPEVLKAASEAYDGLANRLVTKLHWPPESIKVFPQGSASTQTLIRSADASKFDIDAVCRVELPESETGSPMVFFEKIGTAFDGLEVERKNRCWTVEFPHERFYIEFTPSVPLESVPMDGEGSRLRSLAAPEYAHTALAVVDGKTEKWKTSNPQGMVEWVNDAAKLRLIRRNLVKAALEHAQDSIAPVLGQEVDIDDALRIAIRLFKRHRDMSVRRGHIQRETQPISVILVTLLTTMYRGLSDEGITFAHPVELLTELANLLPYMVPRSQDYGYYLANPTVEGENFAERWNDDGGARADTFDTWCTLLYSDLRTILAATGEEAIEKKAREVFGCTGDSGNSGGGGGGVPVAPLHRPPEPPPRTPGLA